MALHLPLTLLNELLRVVRVGRTGEVLVLDRSGNIVGNSNQTRQSPSCNTTLPASSQRDQLFEELITFLLSVSGGRFDSIPSIEAVNIHLDRREYALSTYIVAADAVRWTGVMIVPRSDYFATPDTYFSQSLLVAGVVVVALSLGMMRFTSVLYTHPLLELANAMDHVASTLTSSDLSDSRSIIHEVRAIEHAYKRMAAALQGVGKYVPVTVVQQLVHDAGRTQTVVSTRECTFLFAGGGTLGSLFFSCLD